ncbi:MAG: calcium/sodium antiporter [Chitinophagales bacterium]
MFLAIFLLIIGLVLLVKGADWLVENASALAKKYNVSDLVIGLTIVAFGTSAPELVVNIIASLQKNQDIILGNVIGSNNFNLFIILGITGLISPIIVQKSTVWKEIPFSFFAALLLFLLANHLFDFNGGNLGRVDGIILFIMFLSFLYFIFKQMKNEAPIESTITENSIDKKISLIVVFLILGLSSLILGGKLVVDNAVIIATNLGINEKLIGLTIVAAGTSLPELATSVVAALKKNNDIAMGNIIGSNIFNIFLILSISSIINPIGYNTAFNTDLVILMIGTIFVFIAMFTSGKRILDRWEAMVLLVSYVAYMVYLVAKEM